MSSQLVSHLYDTDEESTDPSSPVRQERPDDSHADQKPTDGHHEERSFIIDRKGSKDTCTICSSSDFRYKCPSCLVRTCSLACFKAHKTNLKCTGLRNSLKFKRLANFDDNQLREDFRFLDDYNRQMDGIKRQKRNIVQSLNDLPNWLKKLKFEANRSMVKLKILPAGFKRRLRNKSTFMYATKEIHWDVELVFTDLHLKGADSEKPKRITFHVHRVPEKRALKELLDAYLKPQTDNQQLNRALKFYHAADPQEICVLIKLSFDYYVELDQRMSIGDCLKGKSIIEYPTLLVVLRKSLARYKVVAEKELRDRMQEYADKSYGLLIKNGVVRGNTNDNRFRGNRFDLSNVGGSNATGKEVEEIGSKSIENGLNETDPNDLTDMITGENRADDYYEESDQSEDDGPPEEVQTRYVFDNSFDDHQALGQD